MSNVGTWPGEGRAAVEDLWASYELHFDEVEAAVRDWAVARRASEPLLKPAGETWKDAIGLAMRGDWIAYESKLQAWTVASAKRGASLGSLCEEARAFTRFLLPHLVGDFVHEPARITAAVQAMNDFADRGASVISDTFLALDAARLRAREEDLSTTLDSIGDAVIVTDQHGRIVRMNPVAERLTGFRTSEAVGLALGEVFRIQSEYTGEPVESPVERVLREGVVVGLANHTVLIARDGTRTAVADSAAPVRRGTEEVRGVVLVFRDVTEERRAEEKLRYWERIFQHATWGVALATVKDVRFQAVNPAYAAMHGYTVEELVGAPVSLLWTPETRAQMEAAAHETLQRDHLVTETVHLCKDGRRIPVELVATTLKDAHGEVTSFVANVQDISERKRHEQARERALELEAQNRRVEEANRLKSEFLANMSHELRTPLNAILGFSELMHDGHVGPVSAKQKEFLGDILTSGHHLLGLINEILDLSKVESGRMDFHPEPVELDVLVHKVVQSVRATALERNLRVRVDVAKDMGPVVLDPARFKQILYNYLSNALKFTPAGGRIFVRVEPEDSDHFRLEVEDTGDGIPADQIARLFTAFQQLDSTVVKRAGGTGLGLALTRRLAEAQGGTVGVRPAPERGSIFFVVLPLCPSGFLQSDHWTTAEAGGFRRSDPPAKNAISSEPLPTPGRTGDDVLVVDDDAASLRLMRAKLGELGYNAICFLNAHEALLALERTHFVAAIIDIIMPQMDGFEFLERVRSSSRHKDLPVMLWTVKDFDDVQRRMLDDTVSTVVQKGAGDGYRLSEALRTFLSSTKGEADSGR